jgi:uncharacterized protein (TIGR02145 family)
MKLFTKYVRALLTVAVLGIGYVSDVAARGAVKTTTFTDTRDGHEYLAVKIGGKTWMAQNLNYKTSNSWCYENDESSCGKYGRLYDWNTAKAVCPGGWHLPSQAEWDTLVNAAGGNVAGKKLKAASGWNENGNGTDDYGFSALPGGYYYDGLGFKYAGNQGNWWTAMEYGSNYAYDRNMAYSYDRVNEYHSSKIIGFSVRCVAD